jgi:hypothetical protein
VEVAPGKMTIWYSECFIGQNSREGYYNTKGYYTIGTGVKKVESPITKWGEMCP